MQEVKRAWKSAWGIALLLGALEVAAAPVTPDKAAQLVRGWLRESPARLGESLAAQIRAVRAYTNFYVVSLAPAGFVVVAADTESEPVIAFSDAGELDPNPLNPFFAILERDLAGRAALARDIADRRAGRAPSRKAAILPAAALAAADAAQARWSRWTAAAQYAAPEGEEGWSGVPSVSDVRVAPLIQSQWNQKTAQGLACYNYFCPPGPDGNANNYYAGCVATAMGQIMRHWQRPTAAYGHAYHYALMPLNPQSGTLTLTNRVMIGRLLRDCGESVGMSYGASGSSANLLIVDDALTGVFTYSNARDYYNASGLSESVRNLVLRSNLAGGFPVIMGISRTGGGHAVVTDGFGYSSGTLYYHVNMGWGGSDDAWYNLPTVDAYYTYTAVDAFVYNIFTNGTGEILAGRVTSSGQPLGGVTVTATQGGNSWSAVTGTNGYYGIRLPSSRTCTVTAAKSGYQSGSLNGIVVGTSGATPAGPCGNYFGADFELSAQIFSFNAFALTNSVYLRWSDPTACGMSSRVVHLRSSPTAYPTNPSDGSLLYEGTNQVAIHTNLISLQPYYYTIWLSHDGTNFIAP